MDEPTLHAAISEVCPIISVSVPHPTDRVQWNFAPKPEATEAQIASAGMVLSTIPADPTIAVATADWIARWTNAEYRLLQDRRMSDNGKTGKDFDIITAAPSVDFNRKRTQSFAADCVTNGILTQARADEIFS